MPSFLSLFLSLPFKVTFVNFFFEILFCFLYFNFFCCVSFYLFACLPFLHLECQDLFLLKACSRFFFGSSKTFSFSVNHFNLSNCIFCSAFPFLYNFSFSLCVVNMFLASLKRFQWNISTQANKTILFCESRFGITSFSLFRERKNTVCGFPLSPSLFFFYTLVFFFFFLSLFQQHSSMFVPVWTSMFLLCFLYFFSSFPGLFFDRWL